MSVEHRHNGESVLGCPECDPVGAFIDGRRAALSGGPELPAVPLDVERLAEALPSVLNFRLTIYPVGHPKWTELAEAIAAEYARPAASKEPS